MERELKRMKRMLVVLIVVASLLAVSAVSLGFWMWKQEDDYWNPKWYTRPTMQCGAAERLASTACGERPVSRGLYRVQNYYNITPINREVR